MFKKFILMRQKSFKLANNSFHSYIIYIINLNIIIIISIFKKINYENF